mgnify:CR=1 FL=1
MKANARVARGNTKAEKRIYAKAYPISQEAEIRVEEAPAAVTPAEADRTGRHAY